jgi:hypothetical protein
MEDAYNNIFIDKSNLVVNKSDEYKASVITTLLDGEITECFQVTDFVDIIYLFTSPQSCLTLKLEEYYLVPTLKISHSLDCLEDIYDELNKNQHKKTVHTSLLIIDDFHLDIRKDKKIQNILTTIFSRSRYLNCTSILLQKKKNYLPKFLLDLLNISF